MTTWKIAGKGSDVQSQFTIKKPTTNHAKKALRTQSHSELCAKLRVLRSLKS